MSVQAHHRILVINSGSSSLRLALFERQGDNFVEICSERFDTIDKDKTALLQNFMHTQSIDESVLVAHRVVHGGARFSGATIIDDTVMQQIESLAPLAPLHNPAALSLIKAVASLLPARVRQVAVFDTAFFHDLPAVARRYAIPAALSREHEIYRYGFHGLAHEYMWKQWCRLTGNTAQQGRLITLQLGSGCSIAAIRDGQALDTSMGFSPLEGLVMATRSGDLDPGILLYLQREAGYSIDELDELLNKHSGLLGLSERSADMRELLAATDEATSLALELYGYRLRKYIGAYLNVLGGAEAIVFGGGVGEHSNEIRARVLKDMQWCGIELDRKSNDASIGTEACISTPHSRSEVWVIPVREELMVARAAGMLCENQWAGDK